MSSAPHSGSPDSRLVKRQADATRCALLGGDPQDLIVLDVQLPDLNGFEVCRRLRFAGVNTPVIFLTAADSVEDRVRGLTIGGDDYLIKPFSVEELVARVNVILHRTGRSAESRYLLRRP